MRHGQPDLITGEGQDGGEQLGHGVQDQVQGGLGAAALQTILLLTVEPVLDDVQIEAAQLHHAEIIDGMGHHMELILVIGGLHLLDQGVELGDSPAVQGQHILGGHQIIGVKAVEVAQAVAGGVAELQIVLAQLLEDLLGAAHVHMVVGGTGPETDHIRAELLDDIGRVNAVAQGLVHGAALAVHGPAVGQALFVGGTLAQGADSHQQGGLEPAAVLVAAFHIHISRPEALIPLHGGVVGGAGVKPAVQSVGLLEEVDAAAVGALEALGQQLCRLHLKPGVGTLLLEDGGHGLDALIGADRLLAVLAVEHGDGQTPAALAGNAPVGTLADHGAHTLLAPGGQPADVLTGLDGLILEGVNGAEPLGGGPEDDGALAAPAVGIAVDDLLGSEEHAALLHVSQDHRVGFLGAHAGVLAGVIGVAALIVHRHHHLHAVAHAGQIVVSAEAGGGVDAAGAGVHGDVIGQQQAGGLGQEGVIRQHILIEGAGVTLQNFIAFKAADVHDLLGQGLGHDVHLAVGRLHDGVALIGVQGDGQVAGQGPDGGGPDHEEQLALVQMAQLAQVVVHGELDVDRGAGVILIFDLGLGQGGLVLGAPVHRLQALVDVAVLVHLAEDAHLVRLEALVHGLVGVLPVADDAQALEAFHLDADVLFGIGLTGAAEVRHAHGLVVQLLLLDDGGFNGHTVVIPAGDIGGIVAPHGVGAGDKVLDGLVQGMTHMDGAVGEGRAVVKVEAGLALVLLEHLVVDVQLLPVPEHLRLPGGQPGTHGEVGFGKVQRCVKIL